MSGGISWTGMKAALSAELSGGLCIRPGERHAGVSMFIQCFHNDLRGQLNASSLNGLRDLIFC